MPILTVTVTDIDTGRGVANAGVYLFEGGGGIEPPENAYYSKKTDQSGTARFDVSGFFRVGIAAKGYEIYDPDDPRAPLEEWKDVWTCWGAVGVARDITYDFPVKRVKPEVNYAIAIGLPLAGLAIVGAAYAHKKGYI